MMICQFFGASRVFFHQSGWPVPKPARSPGTIHPLPLWGWHSVGTEEAGMPKRTEIVLTWSLNAAESFGHIWPKGGIGPSHSGC